MIYSMTGYAAKDLQLNSIMLQLEIRSVNHRFADITIKTNDNLKPLETNIRSLITNEISRGKIDFKCFTKEITGQSQEISIDYEILQKYIDALNQVDKLIEKSAPISTTELIKLPGVLNTKNIVLEEIQNNLLKEIEILITSFKETQSIEGLKIQQMIEDRLHKISHIIKDATQVVDVSIEEYKNKIKTRLLEAIEDNTISDTRLQQEFVFFCQKSDIHEEIDRLNAHISEFHQLLKKGGGIGKRLDFICQEMNREANTFGSKSISIQATQKAVDLKVLIEQIREQVQNIM